ncbi:carbohydrate kinase [Catellatospora sp. TT07R-123]|uniref:rhamnulokinase n=1 Tax=Catellatospora sp. TT07R-123 TaxID=2733863 RepID=UPI001B279880|nr:rhamnulokinase family protein [Catellatospora sp. TT07R-123]GHJ47156.1 carbohydrate kinase [Catellatospora sp. TT07R-123]
MATDTVTVAAADLGASSGRVMVARVGPERLGLTEVHRFTNRPVRLGPTLHWDALALYRGVLDGLTAAARTAGGLDGIGIDSWAVDYGLLDGTGALIGNPVSYRDHRTDGVMEAVHAQVGAEHLYRTTGLQNLPFNTVYQLVAARDTPAFAQARRLLLLPDLLAYWLTGDDGAEITNASTTGLLDATSRTWSESLLAALALDPALLGTLRQPGEQIGRLLPAVAEETGLSTAVPVIAVGSHDTASAVVAVPAASPRFAYVSCGTWSLVGVELRAPVLDEASRAANFTNEIGVDGTVRYLRNVMGLWLLQESVRTWSASGTEIDLDALLRAAAGEPGLASVIDPDDPLFLPPGDMPARIRQACLRTGQPVPESPAALTRCILDSLALAHARTVRQAQQLSGQDVEVVHVVGGGARNALLCQLTADACGLPVLAGPVEATALGNTLVQARALGAVTGELAELRGLIRAHTSLAAYAPGGDARAWRLAESRVHG